jgi:hypothetical protein
MQKAVSALAEHHKYVASVLASLVTKKSGRAEAYKTTCDDYCSQKAFGLGCQPCALSSITSEAECMFPGPFGTGVLCHKAPKTQVLSDTRCCMRKNEDLGYASGNAFTTCLVPKRECDCDGSFDFTNAFEASKYMAPLDRMWTGTECMFLPAAVGGR